MNEKCRDRDGDAVGQTLTSSCRRCSVVVMPLLFPGAQHFSRNAMPTCSRTREDAAGKGGTSLPAVLGGYIPPGAPGTTIRVTIAHHVPKSFSRRNALRTARKGPCPRPQSRAGSSHGVACRSSAKSCQADPRTVSQAAEHSRTVVADFVAIFGSLMIPSPRPGRSSAVCKRPPCPRRRDCAGASDRSWQPLSVWPDEAVPVRTAGRGLA